MNKELVAMKALTMHSIRSTIMGKRVLIPLVMGVFLVIVMYNASRADPTMDGGVDLMGSLVISLFAVLLAMIYGTGMINGDIEDGSIINVATAPVNRGVIFMIYYLSAVISFTFVMFILGTTAYLAYFFPAELTWFRFDYLVSFMWLILLSGLVYSSLFVTLGLLVKKPLYIGLFYVFVWEGFVGQLAGRIGEISINHYILSIGSHLFDHGELSRYSGAGSGTSTLVLVLIWASLLALGAYLFVNREFS